MKIKGYIILDFIEGSWSHDLCLTVKFRTEKQFLYRTKCKTLVCSAWNDFDTYEKFLDYCIRITKEEAWLITTAKGLIVNYMDDKNKCTKDELKKKEINNMVKSFNSKKIEIELDYEVKK